MKVMFVCKVFAEWGGLERVWTDKMNALVGLADYEVMLVTTEQGRHTFPYSLSPAVRHVDLQVPFSQKYRYRGLCRLQSHFHFLSLLKKRLRALLLSASPDVIITNASVYADLLVRAKEQIPLVVECHGDFHHPFHMEPMTWFRRLRTFFHYKSLKRADAIVALTRKDAENWRKINSNVYAIPDIVHLNEEKSYCDYTAQRVMFVGRLDMQKGWQYLSQVWALVQRRHPDWSLDIYGEGAEKGENSHLIPNSPNVYPHPVTSDIMGCYKKCSILIHTSVYEPFGLVIAEAMSCGLPVVAFNCPYGPEEMIDDGVNGFLIPCYDVEAYADKLCALMEDEALRRQLGHSAAQSVQRFSRESILPQWQALFKQLQNA